MSERSFDALLQLVADQRRRQVIQLLRHQTKGQTTLDELVDTLPNKGTDTDKPPADQGEIALQLYHTHLPKLADFGVIEFQPETGAISYLSNERTERLLDSLPDELSIARP